MNKTMNSPAEAKKKLRFSDLLSGNRALVLLLAVVCIILSFTVPNFMTMTNLMNVLIQASVIGLPAIGLTFILITAGNDLSLPTNMACSAILGCYIMRATQNMLLGIVCIMGFAILFGCINGFSVSRLKMIPMIVTLAIQTLNTGISEYVTQGTSIANFPEKYMTIFAAKPLGIPVSVIAFAVCAVIAHFLLSRTIFGRQLFETGINEKAARVNGVNTPKILFLIYIIGGLMAGICGVFTAARLNAAGPSMGPTSAFNNIICSCVLGGASVWGGKGTIVGTVIGSVIMAIITNVMNLLNVNFFVTYVIKGIIIIAVCYIDVVRNQVKEEK